MLWCASPSYHAHGKFRDQHERSIRVAWNLKLEARNAKLETWSSILESIKDQGLRIEDQGLSFEWRLSTYIWRLMFIHDCTCTFAQFTGLGRLRGNFQHVQSYSLYLHLIIIYLKENLMHIVMKCTFFLFTWGSHFSLSSYIGDQTKPWSRKGH